MAHENNDLALTQSVTHDSSEAQRTHKYLLSDESFERLRQAQQRINARTEMTPSLRKMINELVNPEAVEKLVNRLIEQLQ